MCVCAPRVTILCTKSDHVRLCTKSDHMRLCTKSARLCTKSDHCLCTKSDHPVHVYGIPPRMAYHISHISHISHVTDTHLHLGGTTLCHGRRTSEVFCLITIGTARNIDILESCMNFPPEPQTSGHNAWLAERHTLAALKGAPQALLPHWARSTRVTPWSSLCRYPCRKVM